jgi:hypothetical protein
MQRHYHSACSESLEKFADMSICRSRELNDICYSVTISRSCKPMQLFGSCEGQFCVPCALTLAGKSVPDATYVNVEAMVSRNRYILQMRNGVYTCAIEHPWASFVALFALTGVKC